MNDWSGLLDALKGVTVDLIGTLSLPELIEGRVVSADPPEVYVTPNLTLDARFLTVPRRLTDYAVDISADHETEDERTHTHPVSDVYTGAGSPHRHTVSGRKRVIVHNALKAGERVILINEQGGQRYLILDRIGGDGHDADV